MNLLDLLLAVMVGASVVAGFISGFTRTAFGLIATIAGVILGFWFYDTPASWYVGMVGSEMVANMFGFLTVFLLTLAAGAVAGRLVSGVFKVAGLGPLDRLAGAAFGFVRGICAAAAAVAVLIAATPRPVPNWMHGSALLPYALSASNFASNLAPRAVKDAVSGSVDEIRKAWNDEVKKAKRRAEEAFEPAPPPRESEEVVIEPPLKPKAKAASKAKKAKVPKSAPPKPVQQ